MKVNNNKPQQELLLQSKQNNYIKPKVNINSVGSEETKIKDSKKNAINKGLDRTKIPQHEENTIQELYGTINKIENLIMEDNNSLHDSESFSDLMRGLESRFSNDEMTTLKDTFNKITEFEMAGDYKSADSSIQYFDSIIDSKFTERELDEIDFNQFKEDMAGIINQDDMKILEKHFEKALLFEESGAYNLADEQWTKIDSIIDKYDYEEYMEIDEMIQPEMESYDYKNRSLNPKLMMEIDALKKQLDLLKALSTQKHKNVKKNKKSNKMLNDSIKKIEKLQKDGLKSTKPEELIDLVENISSVLDERHEDIKLSRPEGDPKSLNISDDRGSMIDLKI